eukprot:1643706-Prorocentrum_lima.AAC.1
MSYCPSPPLAQQVSATHLLVVMHLADQASSDQLKKAWKACGGSPCCHPPIQIVGLAEIHLH